MLHRHPYPKMLSVVPTIAKSSKYDGPSLCRQVYTAVMGSSPSHPHADASREESLARHRRTSSLVDRLLLETIPRKHRMRLLKAVLHAQDAGRPHHPALDTAVEVHGWEHMHVLARRVASMEALQVESEEPLTDAWDGEVLAMASLSTFLARCGTHREGDGDRPGACAFSAKRVVLELAQAYPHGTGVSEVFTEARRVHATLDSYVRSVSVLYELSVSQGGPAESQIETRAAFFDMVKAHAVRLIAMHHTVQPFRGDFKVDQILVTADEGVDILIPVHRACLLSSSYRAVAKVTDSEWQDCETLDVRFLGEPGFGEGVVREWVGQVSLDLFYRSGYFVPCATDPSVVHPNPELAADAETDTMMEFAGRILGIARRLGIPTGVHLSSACVRMVTMQGLSTQELNELDPVLAGSCNAIRLMPADEEVDLGTFVSPAMSCELFPGGGNVCVRAEDRAMFADMLAECHLRGRNLSSLKASHGIMRGLMSVLACDYDNDTDTFTQICGMDAATFNATFGGQGLAQDVDVAQWQGHTDVSAYLDAHTLPGESHVCDGEQVAAVARRFFVAVAGLTPQERRTLLRFWTGSPSLPHGGFSALDRRLRLEVSPSPTTLRGQRFPSAHTCVRTLVLPGYGNPLDMRYAIGACLVSMDFDDTD